MLIKIFVLCYSVLVAFIFLSIEYQARRHTRLRQEAWREAVGPSADWCPYPGELVTRYRTDQSSDRLAEILRVTVAKHRLSAMERGMTIRIRETVVPQSRRGPVEGRITFEVIAPPASC